MKTRKRFFDDYVFYDPKNDEILIGRPDVKWGNKEWEWFVRSDKKAFNSKGKPKNLIEVGRAPEFSLV